MDCQTCEDLIAAYRHSVSLFKNAVQKGSGALGDDSTLTSAEATRLGEMCKDASDDLMMHWREHQGKPTKSGF